MIDYDTDIVEKILNSSLYWLIGAKDPHDYVILLRKVTFEFIINNSLCKINYFIMLFRTKEKL